MEFHKDENGWRWIPIEWILKHLVYSCDFGGPGDYASPVHFWSVMIETKALDAGFLRMVESLEVNGWKSAINGQIEDYGHGPEFSLTDGHHRLVAALLLCWDVVPVYDFYDDPTSYTRAMKDCPHVYCHPDHEDDDSLLVEVM